MLLGYVACAVGDTTGAAASSVPRRYAENRPVTRTQQRLRCCVESRRTRGARAKEERKGGEMGEQAVVSGSVEAAEAKREAVVADAA